MQRSPRIVRTVALAAFAVLPLPAMADVLSPLRDDAQLADLCFSSANEGWAVGDHGVIWHTADGGERWEQQPAPADCRLSSVFFLDALHGWAAGGWAEPFTHASRGIVLSTSDGGRNWTVHAKVPLPAVRQIAFFDAAGGWAITEPAACYDSTVFHTIDGGRTWSALAAGEGLPWQAGDFSTRASGAVAGESGRLAAVRGKSIASSPNNDLNPRGFTRVRAAGPRLSWAVGQGGLVAQSTDSGQTWRAPRGPLPRGAEDHFDFLALAARGGSVWMAGKPGTRVFCSNDAGATWAAYATEQQVPIRSLYFVGEQLGWACGDFGSISVTRDGGRHWQIQRGGGRRAALLAVLATADELPAELLVRLAADEGYRSAVEVIARPAHQEVYRREVGLPWRVHEAVVRSGGGAGELAWRFPAGPAAMLGSKASLAAEWDRANEGPGLQWLEAAITAGIRTWRPSVIVCPAGDQAGTPSEAVRQAVLKAVDCAADPARYPEQIDIAGLSPWRVQRVVAPAPADTRGGITLATTQLAPRLGVSLSDLAMLSRGVIDTALGETPLHYVFRTVMTQDEALGVRKDFFAGIILQPGSEARRAIAETDSVDLATLRRAAQARRNFQALAARRAKHDDERHYLADLAAATNLLPEGQAAGALLQQAEGYSAAGQLTLAAELFELLADRYPQDPLTSRALVWLISYYASGETAWHAARQSERRANTFAQTAGTQESAGNVVPAGGMAAIDAADRPESLVMPSRIKNRAGKALHYAERLEKTAPAVSAEPSVRFAASVAERALGRQTAAARSFAALGRTRGHDAWWAAAATESWLAERRGTPPKKAWRCGFAAEPPRLDGKLDEPLWQNAEPVELQADPADRLQTACALAYDREYLYLAVLARSSDENPNDAEFPPRTRDADLAAGDHVEIYLDVDRDYATWFRLSVDGRGQTRDDCWGALDWNPQWFVAADRAPGRWTIEAAMPLANLVQHPPSRGAAWAVAAQRLAPGVGFAAWNEPAGERVAPSSFGILLFE